MAGVDFPAEEDALHAVVSERGWANRVSVGNDTFAVLRAGTERGWGVAVVCGAGINCVGVAPDGRQVRFPALGEITGDWGGGYDVGMAAVSAAARSEDGRGPRTSLEHSVPAHFGLSSPLELAEAIHNQKITRRRVIELPRLVFAEAADDAVAAAIVSRLADEVVALARAALTRLDLTQEPVEVVLGGGLLQAADGPLSGKIAAGLARCRSAHHRPSRRLRHRSSARRFWGSTSSPRHPRRRSGFGASSPAPTSTPSHEDGCRWLMFGSSRRRGSTPAPSCRRWTRSTWRSPTASSSSSSVPPAPARRPPCACSPASRRSTPAPS